ncbi:MAG: mechanosensitive ion channel [Candidatus Aminicenantes bacterium]
MKKQNVLFFLVIGCLLMISYTYPQDQALSEEQDWRPAELREMETKFMELNAQVATLDTYSPDKSPDFKELEKINQLVETLDFNQRKFDLLIQQYNLLEDKLFPFILKLSREQPELRDQLYTTLIEYTGNREKSILLLQDKINTVALRMERLEKQIERLQTAAREKELAEEIKQKSDLKKQEMDISSKLSQLEEDRKYYSAKLEDEKEKLTGLKEQEKERAAKIEEKRKEVIDLEQKAAATRDRIERLIHRTFARVREIRLNQLEIPRLNTVKTFIYLSDTAVDTLKEQIQNIDKDIESLKTQRTKELINKLLKGALMIAIALFMIFLLVGISRKISKKALAKMEESEKIDSHRKQRYQTLSSVILSFIKILVWILGVLWVLGELDIDYAPFLVAAGGISLAIGFGAQSLVKDMVSGFFILMEEQFALGDVVEISGEAGTVEKISLRTIKFRSLDGTLHTVPNGTISMVSNKTYQWSRAIVKVGVSYDDDPHKVLSVMNKVCQQIAEDPEWKDLFIEEPTAQGIISFGSSSVDFRVLAKTYPGEHWAVERELHIRIKKAFDQEGIEIPYNIVNVLERKETN